ncbi:MAG: SufE family protein [Fimbriimonadaceae bacterium]
MSLPPRLQQFVEDLRMFPDRNDRIQALISVGERFEPVDESVAAKPFGEDHRVPGCESEAFVWATKNQEGKVDLHYAVENPQGISAMAMAVILKENLSGESPEEIQKVPEDLIYEIFGKELSMGKSMGLQGMITLTKAEAKKLA